MKWRAVEPKRSCWSSELATATEVERQVFENSKIVMLVVRDAEGRCWQYCDFEGATTRAWQVEEVRECPSL